jgi:hypothetical protein
MGDTGLERPALALSQTPVSEDGGAESGAQDAAQPSNPPSLPPELAEVVKAWPNLPEAIRAGILAMVKAATGNGQ